MTLRQPYGYPIRFFTLYYSKENIKMAEAKYIFEKLTPITDSDISVYESAIDFVFENI